MNCLKTCLEGIGFWQLHEYTMMQSRDVWKQASIERVIGNKLRTAQIVWACWCSDWDGAILPFKLVSEGLDVFLADIWLILLRSKRQDFDCMDCNRQWSDTDGIFYNLRARESCKGKNAMVCKTCTFHNLQGVTEHSTHRNGLTLYDALCFDSGWGGSKIKQSLPVSLLSLLHHDNLVKDLPVSSYSYCSHPWDAEVASSACSFCKRCSWLAGTSLTMWAIMSLLLLSTPVAAFQ